MRVLMTLTGKAAHLPARDAYTSPEPFPACTPVGTAVVSGSGGITRFFFRADAGITCKRCLAKLERAHADAITEDALRTATANARAVLAQVEEELVEDLAQPCGQCGSPRSSHRHNSAEGHAFVSAEQAAPSGDEVDDRSGMYVELANGITEFVEAGHRLQRSTTKARGTVTAVGPNAVDLDMDEGGRSSGASWRWERLPVGDLVAELSEAEPARPVPSIVIDPSKYDSREQLAEAAERVRALRDAGVHTQKCRDNGVTATCGGACTRPVTDAQRLAWLEQEGPLSRQLRELAETPPPRLREALAQAEREGDRFDATPQQVADLTWFIAHQAKRFADGLVPESSRERFRLGMASDTATLARWLGMSEPVELASYPNPYSGPDRVAEVRRSRAAGAGGPVRTVDEVWDARVGVQAPLCRSASRRWTTYGATCNVPLNNDGTCPEARDHV